MIITRSGYPAGIITIFIFIPCEFFPPGCFAMCLNDNKTPQVCRTQLSILANLNNAVILMVSVLSPISNSSFLFSKCLRTIQSIPVTIYITVTLMVPLVIFKVLWLGPSICLSLHLLLISLRGSSKRQDQLEDKVIPSYYLILALVFWKELDYLFVSQNFREFYAFHSLWQIHVCAYTFW